MAQPAPDVRLMLPITAACISSPFGMRHSPEAKASGFHSGIDLPAAVGTTVRAAAAGTVVAIRRRGAGGLQVEVRHTARLSTRYDHLGSVSAPLAGGLRAVAQGEVLGRVGRTGVTYGTHLHFELVVNGKPVDPAAAFQLKNCHADETK